VFSVDTEDAVSGGFLIAVLFAAAAATLVTTVWRIFLACPKRLSMVVIEGERSDSAIGQTDSFLWTIFCDLEQTRRFAFVDFETCTSVETPLTFFSVVPFAF
jgi:hypothetical protein